MMNKLGTFILLFCILGKHSLQANALLLVNKQLTTEPVTLAYDDARNSTMGESTNLHIAEKEMYSKEGALEQSRLYSNPYFYYDLQTSQYGWDQRDEIYTLSQPLDLSGKRGNNIKIASNECKFPVIVRKKTVKIFRFHLVFYTLTDNSHLFGKCYVKVWLLH